MSILIDKVGELLPALEDRGTVYLFAFAEREDIDRWDVILSSAWSDGDWAGAVRFVTELMGSYLDPDERTLIARIAVIPSTNQRLQEMPTTVDGTIAADRKVIEMSFLGSPVRRAFIFKAEYPPIAATLTPLDNAIVAHA